MEEEHTNIEELDLRLSIGGSYNNYKGPDIKIEALTSFVGDNEQGTDGFKAKCEIYALKRRETKKKREEKKQRRSEPDNIEEQRVCKRNKNGSSYGNTTAFSNNWSHLQFAYPHGFVHYGPTANGSLVMPCWFMGINNNHNDLGPGQLNSGYNVGYEYDSEHNGCGGGGGGSDGRNAKGRLNVSSVCTSFTGSVNKQSRSCSSHSIADSKPLSRQEHSATSPLQESKSLTEATEDTHRTDKSTLSVDTRSTRVESKDDTKPHSEQNLDERCALPGWTSDGEQNIVSVPQNETKNQMSSVLPSMPCATATGNGPNGRTINGFLYRYMEGEISILCVCHGSLFSPAGFVEHAGGINVSHPMRHITVVPSAF